MPTTEESLRQAREALKANEEFVARMAEVPHQFATVLEKRKNRIVLATPNGVLDVADVKKIGVGDTVIIDPASMQIIEAAEALPIGKVITVQELVGDTTVRVSGEAEATDVLKGKFTDLKAGDKVILDPTGSIVIHKQAEAEQRFTVAHDTNVSWEDIGGQAEAKRAMREAVEMPFLHSGLYAKYNKKPLKGVLLWGPPGCGKTMLGKAAATCLADKAKGDAQTGFISVKGPEILDPYVGVAEATVRNLFARARLHKEKTGVPAVIFIDEADAILGRRGTREAHMEKTIVPMFLSEMDGMDDSGAIVILATNRPDTLDPAIVRDGRIDRKIRVMRPTPEDTYSIFLLHLRNVPVGKDFKPDDLAAQGIASLFDPSLVLCHVHLAGSGDCPMPFFNIVSGSLVGGIVERATSRALHRDIEAGHSKPSGVMPYDIADAVSDSFRENLGVDHSDAILDFANGREVLNIRSMHTHVAKAA